MKAICTIAWKDYKVLVTSPLFILITGLCTTIWSFVYMRTLFEFAQRSGMGQQMGQPMNIHQMVFQNHLALVNLLMIFFVPALTMRLIAEEKKIRTYDLLLTAPISAADIAIGKFLAGFLGVLTLIFVGMLYPLLTGFVADFNYGPLLSAYMGMGLVGGVYVAAGLFASSLTESVVLSVTMAFIFNLTLWFVAEGAKYSDHPIYSAIMEHISIGGQFSPFVMGEIKISAIVFLLSCMALFVFLAERVVESSRWR